MKFLIAGLGSIGRRHLRHLIALGQEDILLYRTHQSTLPDEDLKNFPVETDLQRALAWGPDAVIVSNPTALHLDAAFPAVEAGCHLFLEKPVSHSLERLDEFQTLVAKKQVEVLVGFQFRYHPGLRKIKEILAEGELGRPISFRTHWGEYLPDWHPWEDYRQGYAARKDLGGGVILTLTHPLDYIRMILGDVSKLWAIAGKFGDLEMDVEDTAEIGLVFENGAAGTVHLNYNQRPPRHQLEIVCTRGSIRWDQAALALVVYQAEKESWEQYALPADFERDTLFRSQMAHFLEVIQGKAQPACSLEDGIWALRLALAAHRSSEEGIQVSF